MQYDPIKRSLGRVFNLHPGLRVLFYNLLDLLLLRSWYVRRELRRWEKTARADAKVLDAGSGFGQYVWRMARIGSGYSIKGIDVKEEQVADCNDFFGKRGLANRVVFDCVSLEEFNEQDIYDLVLSVDVMEHIEEDEKVMNNLCNSLRKGGMLIISTPSDKGGSDVHHYDNDGAVGFIDEHVRDGYNADDIRQKLMRSGFSEVETLYSYGKPGSLAWKLSMKVPILALNFTKIFFIVLPFYYLVTYPLAYILNHIDMALTHREGTGLIVKARK